jgi:hypothetical protein
MMPVGRQPDAAGREPMRILDARHTTSVHGKPLLVVLVNHIPPLEDFTYRAIDLRPHQQPAILYVGMRPDGYATHLVDRFDGQGFNGQTAHLPMDDGTVRTVVGPYHGNNDVICRYAPELGARTDIALVDDRDSFTRYDDARNALDAALLPEAADAAQRLADSQALHGQPGQAFPPLDRVPPVPTPTASPLPEQPRLATRGRHQ